MANEIINRVAQSKLITFDLEDMYPKGERVLFDIKDWLFQGLVLKEKDFREALKTHDWSKYAGKNIALYCSTDAIIPGWAYLLITIHLSPFANKIVTGNLEDLETVLYAEALEKTDFSIYTGNAVIIKGCTRKPVPQNAYILLTQKLIPFAKSIMYGEACSSVPIYKKR